MSFVPRLLLVALFALLSACAIPVGVDFDTRADFSRFKTWAWADVATDINPDPRTSNTLIDNRMRAAIEREMPLRGFSQVEWDNDAGTAADMLVTYRITIREKIDSTGFNASFGIYNDPYAWGGSAPEVEQYDEQEIVIDITDAANGNLLWRGSVKERVDDYATPQERKATMDAIVQAILQRFPPGAEDKKAAQDSPKSE